MKPGYVVDQDANNTNRHVESGSMRELKPQHVFADNLLYLNLSNKLKSFLKSKRSSKNQP